MLNFLLKSSAFDPMNIVTPPITASDPVLSCKINENNIVADESDLFLVTVSIIDSISSKIIPNISWAVI